MRTRLRELSGRTFVEAKRRARMFVACLLSESRARPSATSHAPKREFKTFRASASEGRSSRRLLNIKAHKFSTSERGCRADERRGRVYLRLLKCSRRINLRGLNGLHP